MAGSASLVSSFTFLGFGADLLMNWGGLQRERAKFLNLYGGFAVSILRVLASLIILFNIFIWILGLFQVADPGLVGLGLILLGPALLVISFHLYVIYLREHPEFLIKAGNTKKFPLDNFDYIGATAIGELSTSKSWSKFWAAMFQSTMVKSIFYRLSLDEDTLSKLFVGSDPAVEADRLVQAALERPNGAGMIDAFELTKIVLAHPVMKDVLAKEQVSAESAETLVDFYHSRQALAKQNHFWLPENQGRNGGFAKGWAVSYTNLLDHFTTELHPDIILHAQYFSVYGRSQIVEEIVTELNKSNGQNVLLVGETGVGKKELFYSLAAKILNYQTKSELDGKQVRILDLQSLLAAAPDQERLTSMFRGLFNDLNKAGNVVLFIPNVGLIFESQGAGSLDASILLADYLESDQIHIIGTLSPEESVTLLRSKPQLAKNFSTIEVEPPSGHDLERIILVSLPPIENRYQVFFPYTALSALSNLANRYIKDAVSPAREINLIEEVAATTHAKSQQLVTIEDVNQTVEHKVKVPIQVNEGEQSTLLNLEAELHNRIVGQERAVKLVSDALLRARAGLTTGNKPIGTFMFLGPTGVGKTETAKALADIYFGSRDQMIRLDMTEYADNNGLSKLLGTDPNNQPGALTVAIQRMPSAVVLFDEIEKASDMVKNVLLQLLDEGRLTTNFGKVLDFTNTIVIATSNAGSDYIKMQIEKRVDPKTLEDQLVDRLISERVYSPEFLNRFDGVVVYLPLTLAEIKKVVGLQLQNLRNQLREQKGLELEIAPKVVEALAARGYDPVFGARALERVIKQELETAIARELIEQHPPAGSKLVISSL